MHTGTTKEQVRARHEIRERLVINHALLHGFLHGPVLGRFASLELSGAIKERDDQVGHGRKLDVLFVLGVHKVLNFGLAELAHAE